MLTHKSENYITVIDWNVHRSSQSSHIHEAVNRQDWPQDDSYISLCVQWERFCFAIILFALTQLPDHGSYVQYLALICFDLRTLCFGCCQHWFSNINLLQTSLQVQRERFCFTIILFASTQLPDHGSYVQYLTLICLVLTTLCFGCHQHWFSDINLLQTPSFQYAEILPPALSLSNSKSDWPRSSTILEFSRGPAFAPLKPGMISTKAMVVATASGSSPATKVVCGLFTSGRSSCKKCCTWTSSQILLNKTTIRKINK